MDQFGFAPAALLLLLISPLYADAPDLAARMKRLKQPVPAKLDTSRTRRTPGLSITYEPGELRLRTPQNWVITLVDSDGKPVSGAGLRLTGGMPQHGHSFASSPSVKELGSGRYEARGMVFQMPGWWAIEIEVSRPAHAVETVRFDLLVETSLDFAENERAEMKRLWIGSLPPLTPQDPKLIELGRDLFKDTSLSRDGKTSCAVCHRAERALTDGRVLDVPLQGPRKVPSISGVAWQTWFFWDGRKDSLWSQALAPIVNKNEYGMTERSFMSRVRAKYGKAFARLGKPNPTFADVGHAIAAFETTLIPSPSAFDRFVERKLGLAPVQPVDATPSPFGDCEQTGFKTFIGKGRCISCHNGPRFENNAFHNTGVPILPSEQGNGRYSGIKLARKDPHRCRGSCPELEHAVDGTAALLSSFKTPTLRNVAITPPYMHNGSMTSLEQVIEHYQVAPPNAHGTDLLPLELTSEERKGLVCFLKSLTGESFTRP